MTVAVEHLTKRFAAGALPALRDVSFTAPAGQLTALLGPSGAGKSTLLRLIAGLETPDQGRVLAWGRDVTDLPSQRRGMGLVSQSYGLFRHMTVRDNVAFGLGVRHADRGAIDRRVAELLELVQLGGCERRFPPQLSGGQRQRVALARALATAPAVLLLDEPFGALDVAVRGELRGWLRALHARTQVTTLLVTHDQAEALELADHVVVMAAGRVAQAGPPEEVYDRPADPFVAAFIGGATLLRGRVRAGRVEVGSLSLAAPPGAPEGAPVRAFVRPRQVRLGRPGGGAAPGVALGRVERLVRIAGTVKVGLRLPSGEAMTVQLPRAEVEALGLGPGAEVLIDLREATVFVGDRAA